MRILYPLALVLALVAGFGVAPVQAQFADVAVVSATLGVNANRLCLGENGTRGDIGCPTYAPFVSATSGYVGIGTTAPSNRLTVGMDIASTSTPSSSVSIGDTSQNSALTIGQSNSDRVVLAWVYNALPGSGYAVLGSTVGRSLMLQHSGGNVGINFNSSSGGVPSSTLHVNGAINFSQDSSATTNTCDTNRAGAMRWNGTEFQVCYGSGGWATLSSAAISGTLGGGSGGDRITSGTTAVVANTNGFVSLTTGGTTTGYMDTAGRLVVPGISATTNQSSFTTVRVTGNTDPLTVYGGTSDVRLNVDFPSYEVTTFNSRNKADNSNRYLGLQTDGGNVGIGTDAPSATLHVSGSVHVPVGGGYYVRTNDNTTWNGGIFGDTGNNLNLQSRYGDVNVRTSKDFTVSTTAGVAMRIVSSGYVGFGASAPSATVHVRNASTDGNLLILERQTQGYFKAEISGAPMALSMGWGSGGGSYVTSGIIMPKDTTNVGIGSLSGNFIPSSTLHVNGGINIGQDASATTNTCDSFRAGAMRWNGTEFQVCYGSGGWATLSSAAISGTLGGGGQGDRITSNTSNITVNTGGTISITTNGSVANYFDTGGRLVTTGISATTNQTSVTTLYATSQTLISTTGSFYPMFIRAANNTTDMIALQSTVNNGYSSIGFLDNGGVYAGGFGYANPSEAYGYANTVYFSTGKVTSPMAFSVSNTIRMKILPSGNIGMSTETPSTTLHVSGTVRIANGGETCDTNRAGGVRWNGTEFQVCYGSGGWATLSSAATSGTVGAGVTTLASLTDVSMSASGGNIFAGTITGSVNAGVTNSTALGYGALASASNNGDGNTAIGNNALGVNTTGNTNTSIGNATLRNNTVGSNNAALGSHALAGNNVGGNNLGIGASAGYNQQSGSLNTFIGSNAGGGIALYSVTGTTAIGYQAGANITTNANYNTLIGVQAGNNITSGANNIVIGTILGTRTATGNYQLNIGNTVFGDMGSATAIGGAAKVGINFVTPTQALEVSGTVSATAFVGDGSGLTGITGASSDRIISGTAAVTANSATNNVSITTSGVVTAYFNTSGRLIVPGVSITQGYGISSTAGYFSGNVGIGTDTPSTTLHVHNAGGNATIRLSSSNTTTGFANLQLLNNVSKGFSITTYNSAQSTTLFGVSTNNLSSIFTTADGLTIGTSLATPVILGNSNTERMRIANNGYIGINTTVPSSTLHVDGAINFSQDASATTNVCDSNRAGAMRWNGTEFQVCYGSGGWATLSSAAISGTLGGGSSGDRIVSGTSDIMVTTNSSITFDTAGNQKMLIGANDVVGIGPGSPVLSVGATSGLSINHDTKSSVLRLQTSGGPWELFTPFTNGNFGLYKPDTAKWAFYVVSSTMNMGIGGNVTPSTTLDISGTVRATSTASNQCNATSYGAMRFNTSTGKPEICRPQ